MKKHRYQAIYVNDIDWKSLAELAAGQPLVFGVDVAKTDCFGVLMRADRRVVKTIKWAHPTQTRELVAHLQCALNAAVCVAMEPSGTYGDALRGVLDEQGLTVYRVSPKRTHDAAELYDGVPSLHDAKAAYLIARLHLEGASAPWVPLTVPRRDQHALVAERDLYQQQHQANLNRLAAALARHWPEVTQWLTLSTVSLPTLIAEYGDPAEVAAHREAAAEVLRRASRGLLRAEKAQAVLDSGTTTLGLAVTDGERRWLQRLGEELLRTHRALAALEQRIAAVVDADRELSRLAAVVGKPTSVVLAATQGSPLNYPNPPSYLKALGLNLKEHSSGKHCGQLKLTKRGSAKARQYLYFAALRYCYTDPVISAWYQRKVARDGGRKGKAITAVMRKLARALWHVARGEVFDSRKLFDVRHLGMAA